jgi:hypothetical protein
MLYKTFAFLSLALLAAAQDNATDDLFGNFGNMTQAVPCTPELEAVTLCDMTNNCNASCQELEEATDAPMEPFGGFDPTNITAMKESFQKGLEEICAKSGKEYCHYKECCPSCTPDVKAVLMCYFNEAIPAMQNQLEDMVSGMGGLLDTLVLSANELTNETIAPSTNFAAMFDDLFSNYTCDVAAFECGAANATRL